MIRVCRLLLLVVLLGGLLQAAWDMPARAGTGLAIGSPGRAPGKDSGAHRPWLAAAFGGSAPLRAVPSLPLPGDPYPPPASWPTPPAVRPLHLPSYAGSAYPATSLGQLVRSYDRFQHQEKASAGLPKADIVALAAGGTDGATVYAGLRASGLWISRDSGASWKHSATVPLSGTVTTTAMDPRQSGRVYAAISDGTLSRSDDAGKAWSSSRLPGARPATCLAALAGSLYAGTGQGVVVSLDGGTSWRPASGGLPHTAVNGLAIDPRAPRTIFAATDKGLYQTVDGGLSWHKDQGERYVSTDGGASWQAVGGQSATDLAGARMTSVAVDPHVSGVVVAGDDQFGIFSSHDGGATWRLVAPSFVSWQVTGSREITDVLFDAAQIGPVLAGNGQGQISRGSDSGRSWPQEDYAALGTAAPVLLATAAPVTLPSDPVPAPAARSPLLYFATHHTLGGAFLAFYKAHGGLRIFGQPLTEPFIEVGQRVQYFERARLVGAATVSISPLGYWQSSGYDFPAAHARGTGLYFPETRHALSGRFLRFWQAHDGALLFGPPISEPFSEQNRDGTDRSYLVQYFRNARLEYHKELAGTPYEVSEGLLGAEYLGLL